MGSLVTWLCCGGAQGARVEHIRENGSREMAIAGRSSFFEKLVRRKIWEVESKKGSGVKKRLTFKKVYVHEVCTLI